MAIEIKSVDMAAKAAGKVALDEGVFGVAVRKDILHRVVRWQLAKRRAGSHNTKGVSEITGTSKKPWKQKGTGRARFGSLKAPQMRGGGVAFGPKPRSHAYALPKKVRKLGLKMALSAKQAEGRLVVLKAATLKSGKTGDLASSLEKLGWSRPLLITGAEADDGFVRAARNLRSIDLLPQQGANVYDILRHDTLVLTADAVEALEARLK
ncbi:MAG: 50S ribosomal protein L4 [Rhodospirillaceae bacterium]|nr:50S ribosomal protein L4 [Rhodospirillaceae bacterium]